MTAVELAVKKLSKFIPSGNQLVIHIILEEAKELEKQQIIEAYRKSTYQFSVDAQMDCQKSAEQYYNETFNK